MNHEHSFLFDVYRWPEHSELANYLEELVGEIPKHYKTSTNLAVRNHLKLFLCNLYVAHYYDKPIAISTRNSSFAQGRYKKLWLKRCAFNAVLEFLEKKGLVEKKTGYAFWKKIESHDAYQNPIIKYLPGDKKGSLTKIWPSDQLRKNFDKKIIEPLIMKKLESPTVILRDKDKNEIAFEETDFTRDLASKLFFLNSSLSKHYFSFDNSTIYSNLIRNPYYLSIRDNEISSTNNNINEVSSIKIHDNEISSSNINNNDHSFASLREPIVKSCRFDPSLKAVFNLNFCRGGRLYSAGLDGGNWQSMPQSQRATIKIDGMKCTELDYKSFHISLLYAVHGIQLQGDPYKAIDDRDSMRPIIKKFLLTVLNAKDEREAIRSIQDQIQELMFQPEIKKRDKKFLDAYFEVRPDWADLIDLMREVHYNIADYFCTGAGIMLQRIDAKIMSDILLDLAEQNIPCLPVHDSAIVPFIYGTQLAMAMNVSYMNFFKGLTCDIDVKY